MHLCPQNPKCWRLLCASPVLAEGDGRTAVAKQQILLVMSFRLRPTGNLEMGEGATELAARPSFLRRGWTDGRARVLPGGDVDLVEFVSVGVLVGVRGWVRLAGWPTGRLAFILAAPPRRRRFSHSPSLPRPASASPQLRPVLRPLFCSSRPKTKVSHASLKT